LIFIGGTTEPGGLHVHTADLALAAAASGRPVTVVCPSVDHFSAMFRGTPVQVRVVPPRDFSEPPRRYWPRVLAGFRSADAVLVRGDLAAGCVGDLLAIRLSVRRFYTIEHRGIERGDLDARALRRHGWAMRLTMRRTVTVSDAVSDEVVQVLGLPRRRVITCLNWFDPSFRLVEAAERVAAKRRLGVPERALVVGYHGRLAREKRVDALVDAFAVLPAVVAGVPQWLVLIGDGWKRAEIEGRIRALGVGDRVVITGWQPHPREALAAVDVSVLPSLAEGFPLGLLEAMASGAACLAHPMPSTERIIDSGRTGWLADLADPVSFAAALAELVARPAEVREAMGRAAAAETARAFSRAARLPAVLRALDLDDGAGGLPERERGLEFAR
jgi:glycosyltransferase involved in cell wall biosynthesis